MTARPLLLVVMALPLFAQQPPAPTMVAPNPATAAPAAPAPEAQAPATPAPSTTAAAAPEAASPVPTTESWFNGYIDVGYTWRSDVGGSLDAYRSIINLGSGPKLIGADFSIVDPKHRLFDEIRVRASGWGDDPYETFHLDAKKSKAYEFNADYRDIAYFDFLPSYADPLLARGVTLNEQSFDTRRHMGSYRLDLLPGNWIIPYLAYDRDSGSGAGVTTFVTDANTFPAPNTLNDLTNLYRGGIRIERKRFHVTLEEGGTTFSSNQNVFQSSPGAANFGNVTTPIFGQTTELSNLLAAYGVRGSSVYSKGLITANVASWLDFYGQFLYSEPDTNVHYQQADTGNLLLQSQLLFYTSQQYLVSAAAKLPHTTGSFGMEIRPFRRLHITQSWLTDRLHNTGSAMSTNTLMGASVSAQMTALLASSLVTNYNQAEVIAFYDATSKVVFHVGYRYVWGDASDAVLPAEGLVSADEARLRRNVGLGGVTFRASQKLSLKAEAEVGSSGGAYFRTSLYDYEKVRAQARYQALKTLSLAADFMALINNNPTPGVNYNSRTQQESLSMFWSPGKTPGKTWNLEGSYTRSAIYSDIGYLDPGSLQPETSLYRDNAYIVTALIDIKLARGAKPTANGLAKITAGGSLFISSGSEPTRYYQPFVKLLAPVSKKISWFGEWRYYGYGEVFSLYEGFRANLITTGLRFTPGPKGAQ
ncbi:MAG TPA: hypothetical protein VGG72_12195 [Bryobacteraceae bacterium]|jgi:hypothetical protein